jgi:hypothetical protein
MQSMAPPSKNKKQKRQKSLNRLHNRARREADWAKPRPKNRPIKKYDIKPIISHLRIKK